MSDSRFVRADSRRRAIGVVLWCASLAAMACSGPTGVDTAPSAGGVASVAVDPSASTLTLGSELPLQAVVQDAGGRRISDATVVWSVKDPDIAKVSAAGVVTALAIGSTQVAANANGKSGVATITVQRVPVATVSVSPAQLQTVIGAHPQLTAVAYDASGGTLTGRAVVWSSSNAGVATVDASGIVSAVAPGTATITATSEGRSGAAAVTVGNTAVGSVVVTPQTTTVVARGTATLAATVKDANGAVVTDRAVTWSSSNTQIATVSSTGVVTGVAPGTATITAASEGKSGSASVVVARAPVGSVAVLPPASNLIVGQSATLSTTVKDANGDVVTDRVVTWASSNVAVATVSASGVVSAVGVGSATITATSEGKAGSATVTVSGVPVGSVSVAPSTLSLFTGRTGSLTATVRDANGTVVTDRPVTWTSSDTRIATVSSTGVVTAVAAGTATITATSETKSGTAAVTVTRPPVNTVTVSPSSAQLPIGSTLTLTPTVTDVNGTVVTDRTVAWISSDTRVATVSSTGVVTPVSLGHATITATSEGRYGSSVVTVVTGPAATVDVTPSSATIRTGGSVQLSATARDAAGNPITGRAFTWTSSDDTRATVDSNGFVRGRRVATVTITATLDGKSDTSIIVVSP